MGSVARLHVSYAAAQPVVSSQQLPPACCVCTAIIIHGVRAVAFRLDCWRFRQSADSLCKREQIEVRLLQNIGECMVVPTNDNR